jgi:hypothetical protein
MYMRRFLMLAIASLVIAGAQLAPAITTTSQAKPDKIRLADGEFPPPEECGLYDICKVTANS